VVSHGIPYRFDLQSDQVVIRRVDKYTTGTYLSHTEDMSRTLIEQGFSFEPDNARVKVVVDGDNTGGKGACSVDWSKDDNHPHWPIESSQFSVTYMYYFRNFSNYGLYCHVEP